MVTDTTLHLSWVLTASYISNSVSKNKCIKLFIFKELWSKMDFLGLASPDFMLKHFPPFPPLHHCKSEVEFLCQGQTHTKCLLNRGSEAGIRKIYIRDSPKYAFSPLEHVRIDLTVYHTTHTHTPPETLLRWVEGASACCIQQSSLV